MSRPISLARFASSSLVLAAALVAACGGDATGETNTTTTTHSTGCSKPEECPGTDGVCGTRTCAGGVCGVDPAPEGTPLPTDSIGDCARRECDGAGAVREVPDDTDTKTDGKECTVDACVGGQPQSTPKPEGTPCTEGGGTTCWADGSCHACAAIDTTTCSDSGLGEPNDSVAEATAQTGGNVVDSAWTACGVLSGAELDFYRFQGTGSDIAELDPTVVADGQGVRVCVYLECTGGTVDHLTCPSGTTDDALSAERPGCCASGGSITLAKGDFACAATPVDVSAWVKVEHSGAAFCVPYELDVHF